jgi:hypothetical protein
VNHQNAECRPLPALCRALQRRHGLSVSLCEFRRDQDGYEGVTLQFGGNHRRLFEHFGFDPSKENQRRTDEFGAYLFAGGSGDHAYVIIHSYDSDPKPRGGRPFPTKKLAAEVDRIWRRVVTNAGVRP